MPKDSRMKTRGRLGLRRRWFSESHGPAVCSHVLARPFSAVGHNSEGAGKEKQVHPHAHLVPLPIRGREGWGICPPTKALPKVNLDKHFLKYSIPKLSGSTWAAGYSLPHSGFSGDGAHP